MVDKSILVFVNKIVKLNDFTLLEIHSKVRLRLPKPKRALLSQEDLKDFYKPKKYKEHLVVVKTSIYPFKRDNVLCAIKSVKLSDLKFTNI
jgi:hypothetical protein